MTDWQDTLKAVAPSIAGAIGGPFGSIAAKFLLSKLGEHPETSDSGELTDLLKNAVMAARPVELSKIKKADHDFRLEMKKMDIDLAKIEADDRASARDRQARTGDQFVTVFASAIFLVFTALLFYIIYLNIEINNFVATLLGYLAASFQAVVTYYFGSSKGSSEKNKMFEGLKK